MAAAYADPNTARWRVRLMTSSEATEWIRAGRLPGGRSGRRVGRSSSWSRRGPHDAEAAALPRLAEAGLMDVAYGSQTRVRDAGPADGRPLGIRRRAASGQVRALHAEPAVLSSGRQRRFLGRGHRRSHRTARRRLARHAPPPPGKRQRVDPQVSRRRRSTSSSPRTTSSDSSSTISAARARVRADSGGTTRCADGRGRSAPRRPSRSRCRIAGTAGRTCHWPSGRGHVGCRPW